IGLIAWRGDRLRTPGRIDSPVSRESAFLANNLLFAGLAFVVLLGTVYPLLAEAIADRRLSVGEPYFDRMTTPLGITLLFLMAAAPALPWRATNEQTLRHRLFVPAWVGVAAMFVALLLGARGLAPVAAFGLAGFALAGIARQFAAGIAARRRAHDESVFTASGRTVRGDPRLYGGLIVHVGVVLIAVALAASSSYSDRAEVRLTEGDSAALSGYTFTYLGSDRTTTDQKTTFSVDVRVERGSRDLGVYSPSISTFPNATQGIGTPSVRTGLLEDVYLTLVSSPNDEGRVAIAIAINPLVVWLWIGGGVMALGTIIALAPTLRRTRRLPAPADSLVRSAPSGAPPSHKQEETEPVAT
ncbi:MAG: cytochrome c-type biogenesis CcmF C-terminal domain-containing protein, partial [Acidimicrobiia bacterium]